MLGLYSPYTDPGFDEWLQQLESLPDAPPVPRRAHPAAQDAQWMRWVQAECPSLFIQSIDHNMAAIKNQLVFIAEIDACPVGFCVAFVGRYDPSYLFIKRVGVVPLARRRGAGFALLSAAVGQEPLKNIAGATLVDDSAAHALNEAVATSLGSVVQAVPRRRFRPTDLGLGAGEPHRPWLIDRQRSASPD